MRNSHGRKNFVAVALVAAIAAVFTISPVNAKPLRWANQGDAQTMDPYSQNEGVTNNVNQHMYERLVSRDEKLAIVTQGLAERYQQVDATTWRFFLRKGVKFHDGAAFTADDVVFSIERAAMPTSQIAQYARAVGKVSKIDDFTVEFKLEKVNPIFLEHIETIFIMNKAWAVKNKVEKPLDFKNKEETFAARNANGTGIFMLKTREPDVKTVMVRNPNYWNNANIKSNVTEVILTPIKQDATRTAALLSGEIDVLHDPAPQDVQRLGSTASVKVWNGMENRVVFLGMDQSRDELLYSDVKGKNPFKDKRVRQALYQAIDIETIKRSLMRGQAFPTGCLTTSPAGCESAPDADKRLPFDAEASRKLLAEAGYPQGFGVGMNCPNNRYINDEEICQAIVAMLARVNVKVKLVTEPRATYFPRLEKGDTSFYMLGWGGAVIDPQTTLDPIYHSPDEKTKKGAYNYGRFSDPKLDAIIDAAAVEGDATKRRGLLRDAIMMHNAEIRHIPLHRQVIPWATRGNVRLVHQADNYMRSWLVNID
jgi:peptide/nickel transport system substrate-binding protein